MLPYSLNCKAFDDLGTEAAAYWFGFIFADGSVSRTMVTLTLAAKDRPQLEGFLAFIECNKAIRETENKNQTGKSFPAVNASVSDRYLSDRLRSLGVEPFRPRSTAALHAVPDMQRHHFLRGWFDGDGSALRMPQLTFVAAPDFIDEVAQIFEQQAGANPVIQRQVRRQKTVATLTYKGVHRCGAIVDYLYRDATIWLPRKRERIDGWPAPQRAKADRFCPQCGHSL